MWTVCRRGRTIGRSRSGKGPGRASRGSWLKWGRNQRDRKGSRSIEMRSGSSPGNRRSDSYYFPGKKWEDTAGKSKRSDTGRSESLRRVFLQPAIG